MVALGAKLHNCRGKQLCFFNGFIFIINVTERVHNLYFLIFRGIGEKPVLTIFDFLNRVFIDSQLKRNFDELNQNPFI